MKGHKMMRNIKDELKNEGLTTTLRRQLGMKSNVMQRFRSTELWAFLTLLIRFNLLHMSLVYVINEITVQNERESVGEGESEGRRDVLAEDNKDEECGGGWEGGEKERTEESSVQGTKKALQQCNDCNHNSCHDVF